MLLVLAAVAAVRAVALPFAEHYIRNPDSYEYTGIAQNLREGHGYSYTAGDLRVIHYQVRDRAPHVRGERVPTALRPPGYPLFLAMFHPYAETAAPLVQILLALANVALLCWIVLRAHGRRAAIWAGLLAAVYPYHVYFTVQVQPEIVLQTFLLAGAALLQVGRERRTAWAFAGAGAAGALGVLVHPAGLAFLPAAFLWTAWVSRERWKAAALRCVVLTLCAAIPIGAWTYRNYRTLGAPIPTSTLTGLNFWLGNAYFGEHGTQETFHWFTVGGMRDRIQGLSEPEMDRMFMQEAREYILAHPGRILAILPSKLLDMWRPHPHPAYYPRVYVVTSLIGASFLYLFALVGIAACIRRREALGHFLVPVVLFTLMAMLAAPVVRHRASTVDVFLLIPGGVGASALWAWVRGLGRRDRPQLHA